MSEIKINFMENEATQHLRDFIRSLVDNLTMPFIRKIAMFEKKFETICENLGKERTEINELVKYIKSYELVKEQEIKNLHDRLFSLEQKVNPEMIDQEIK
jgi:hypothetical protein